MKEVEICMKEVDQSMHSKLASLVRNDISTFQIVKFALDFAI